MGKHAQTPEQIHDQLVVPRLLNLCPFSGLFSIASLNSLWRALTSESLCPEDERAQHLLKTMDRMIEEQSKPVMSLLIDYYWIVWILKKLNLFQLSISCEEIIRFAQPTIKAHRLVN